MQPVMDNALVTTVQIDDHDLRSHGDQRSTETPQPLSYGRAAAPAAVPIGLTTLGLGVVLLGTFLSVTDGFIVNVALPTIGSDLRGSVEMLQLVVAGYGVPYALLLVVGGRLGDAVGRRRAFVVGMAA